MSLVSLRKQTDFPPVALRRGKIPSVKPSRKATSLTSQDLTNQNLALKNQEVTRVEPTLKYVKTWHLRKPIAKSVRFSQAND